MIILCTLDENVPFSLDEKLELNQLMHAGKYLMAAQELKEKLTGLASETNQIDPNSKYQEVLEGRFIQKGAKPGLLHQRIVELDCPLIITTNYDTLMESAVGMFSDTDAIVATFDQTALVRHILKGEAGRRDDRVVFKIHGTIAKGSGNVVLTELDYRKLMYHSSEYRTLLQAVFTTRVVLMIGFSMSDPELGLMMESVRNNVANRQGFPDYMILPAGEKGPIEQKRLLRDFGVKVIEYEAPNGDHAELTEIITHLSQFGRLAAGAK